MYALNTLQYSNRLIAVGVDRKQAEVHAESLSEVFNEELKNTVCTKQDLQQVKQDLQQAKSDLESQILKVDNKIDQAKSDLESQILKVDNKIDQVKSELQSDNKLIKWMVGFQFTISIAILLKLFLG